MLTNNRASAPPPSINPDFKAVHAELIAYAHELDDAVGRAKTSKEVNAILDELDEVTARIVSVGRQLFTQQTESISKACADVIVQAEAAKKAARQIDDLVSFIKGTTQFLAVVDKLVDTAKLVL